MNERTINIKVSKYDLELMRISLEIILKHKDEILEWDFKRKEEIDEDMEYLFEDMDELFNRLERITNGQNNRTKNR